MIEPEPPRILVLDLRRERAALLRKLLEPLGVVTVAEGPGAPARSTGAVLAVIDPPALGLDPTRLRAIRRALGRIPIIVLGAVSGTATDGVLVQAGPLLASELRAAVTSLLARSPLADTVHRALARLVPLTDDVRALLERAAPTRAPVVLAGEPGTGKSLLARGPLTVAGAICESRDLPDPELDSRARALSDDDTLYLGGLEGLGRTEQGGLLALIDRSAESGPRLVFAVERDSALLTLRDDLRLRLEPVVVTLPPLRDRAGELPGLFASLTAFAALRHGIEPPELDPSLSTALAAYPWPLNFEELLAAATGAVFRVAGRPVVPSDLARLRPPPRPSEASPRPPRSAARDPRSLEALVQDLAHEIRNPLVSIKTFTQLLPDRFDDAEFRQQYHHVVADDIDRIDAVLSELADFTRFGDPSSERLDLARVVRRVLDSHQADLRKRAVEAVVKTPDARVFVHADAEIVAYAFDAVLREALAALPDGGRIDVTLGAAPGGAADRGSADFRYRGTARPTRAPRADRAPSRREVLGLRHTLASNVLGLIGAELTIEDTLEGETHVTVTFDEPD